MVTLTQWIDGYLARRALKLAPSTISGYRGNLRRYIAPTDVGQMPLTEVTDADLIVLLSPIMAKGYTRQAQLVQILLGAALKDAVRRRIIPANPMDFVDRIEHKSAFTAWLSPDEARQLLASARAAADPFYPAWLLGISCGLRRGELLGLRWDDIDLSAGVLHVRRQLVRVDGQLMETKPKTLASVRDVVFARWVADQLRFCRGCSDRVVTATPDGLRDALEAACSRAGVPRITLHGLRHTMAAVAASDGVPIKVLQELMGHAQYQTTADIYAHVERSAVGRAAHQIAARLEIA